MSAQRVIAVPSPDCAPRARCRCRDLSGAIIDERTTVQCYRPATATGSTAGPATLRSMPPCNIGDSMPTVRFSASDDWPSYLHTEVTLDSEREHLCGERARELGFACAGSASGRSRPPWASCHREGQLIDDSSGASRSRQPAATARRARRHRRPVSAGELSWLGRNRGRSRRSLRLITARRRLPRPAPRALLCRGLAARRGRSRNPRLLRARSCRLLPNRRTA